MGKNNGGRAIFHCRSASHDLSLRGSIRTDADSSVRGGAMFSATSAACTLA